jgi:eukaryotic-like serine/threonine-protein kinase
VKIGRYQVTEVLGKGTYGRVMKGFDPLIARSVAIKLLSPELARGSAKDRFLQEARVVGQLSHTTVITLHDMGIEQETETPYLVMEYVEGQTLDRVLEKGTIPFPKACAWAGDLASGLHVAHRKGVIHGDVKPANVLVTNENRVKLMDFGMARLASHDTKDTPLAGTPAYWCPEQIMGKPQDGRSDLFSLGVSLYEMATGNRPFDAESLQAICSRVLSSTPLPPSRLNPSLPTALDEIIMSCLAKDPAQRFASGDLLAEALYPLARRKTEAARATPAPLTLRDRASRLLRSA